MTVKLTLHNYCESRLIGYLRSTTNILLLSLISFWVWPLYADTGASELSVKFQEKNFSTTANSLTPTSDGGFLIVGNLFDDAGPSSWGQVTKISRHGEIKWQKEFGEKAKNSDFLKAVTTTRGEYVLVGSVNERFSGQIGESSGWVLKIDQKGQVLWDKALRIGQIDRVVDVALLPKDNLLVLGRSRQGEKDTLFVLKLDAAGQETFRKKFSFKDNVFGNLIRPVLDGGFIVGGTKFLSLDHKRRGWLASFTAEGELQWEQVFRDGQGEVTAATPLSNGRVVLSHQIDSGEVSVALIMLDKSGRIYWESKLPRTEICGISAMWISARGKLFAAGSTCDTSKEQIWLGNISANGDVVILKKLASIHNAKVKQILPLNKGIAAVLHSRLDLGNSISWLFVGAEIRELE